MLGNPGYMSWQEFLIWATFGFSIAAAGLVNLILYSTILGPPAKGASRIQQVKIFALRFPFFLLAILGLMLQRPLILAYDQHKLGGAIIFMCFMILTAVFGLKVLLPHFVTIKTMTDN